MKLSLTTSKPFSFAQTLAFVRRFPPCQGQYIVTEDSLTAAIAVDGKAAAFTLRGDTPDTLAVEVDASLPPATRHEVAARASQFVGANDAVAELYAAADGDEPFARLVELLHGLHHVRFLSLSEIAVYSVLMQRAPIAVAAALKRRFFTAFGLPIDVDRHTLFALPELATLATLDVDTIAAAIRHRGKAERIVEVVRGVHALGEHFLTTAPYAEARDALLAIRGIGPFSAAAILLRGLGRMDELPWLPAFASAARALYRRPVSHATIVRRYGPLIGYWSFYVMTGVPRLPGSDIVHA